MIKQTEPISLPTSDSVPTDAALPGAEHRDSLHITLHKDGSVPTDAALSGTEHGVSLPKTLYDEAQALYDAQNYEAANDKLRKNHASAEGGSVLDNAHMSPKNNVSSVFTTDQCIIGPF